MSSAFRLLAITIIVCQGCSGSPTPRAGVGAGDSCRRFEELLDAVESKDDPFQGWSVQGGHVEVSSTAVSAVAEKGLRIMPCLLDRMRDPTTSFNQFVRYYSAAVLILQGARVDGPYGWSGGLPRVIGPSATFEPGSIRYDQAFQDRVSGRLQILYENAIGANQ